MATVRLSRRMTQTRPSQVLRASELLHPRIVLAYCCCLLGVVLCSFHPVLSFVVLVCCLLFSFMVHGSRKTLKSCTWQLPLIAIIALANPLFSASGSSELFRLGTLSVYTESLWYGLSSAAVFVSCLLIFSCMNKLLSAYKFISLFPTWCAKPAFIAALALHLLPTMLKRGELLLRLEAVNSSCRGSDNENSNTRLKPYVNRARSLVRPLGILLSISLEESLDRAQSLIVRGFSEAGSRSNAARSIWTAQDSWLLFLLIAHCILALCLLVVLVGQSRFYPVVSIGNTFLFMGCGLLLVSLFAYPLLLLAYWQSLWRK